MRERSSGFVSSEFEAKDRDRQPGSARSSSQRKALLAAGASAIALGLWHRRIRWPAAVGGTVLLARAAAMNLPREYSCEVSQTIYRTPSDVFAYLSDKKNWPAFMKTNSDRGFDNFRPEDSSTISESGQAQLEQSLRWTSKSDSKVRENTVELRPAPGDRGTEVHWRVHYRSPQSFVTDLLRTSVGASLEQSARESLRPLKQLLETGEVATTDGQPRGDRGLKGRIERRVFRESPDEKPGRRRAQSRAQQRVAS